MHVGLLALRFNPFDGPMLAAVFGWAVYAVLLRCLPGGSFPPSVLLVVTKLFGFVALVPSWLADVALPRASLNAVAATAGAVPCTALFASIGASSSWIRRVALVGPASARPFLYLLVWGRARPPRLGKRPKPFRAAGFASILLGLRLGR